MKKTATKFSIGIFILALAVGLAYWANTQFSLTSKKTASQKIAFPTTSEEGEEDRAVAKKARYEYFFRQLRDPATNTIPDNIRSRELRHARSIPTVKQILLQSSANNKTGATIAEFNWLLAGPPAVGGRTRALGIDQRDPNIIIAGGVSGGIWRSTDGGDSWTIRTPDFDNFSVTSLAQDPTNPETWYYTSGEFLGNSARAPGAIYSGTGIFRSTDNGLSWSRIPGTEDIDATTINTRFDAMSRVAVNPATGTVYVASNGVGILRSPNGNNYDEITLGGLGEHQYADVTAIDDGTSDGRLLAVLSSEPFGQPDNDPGIFVSNDDGQTWNNITPASFPNQYFRSVAAIAPSDPDIAYVFSSTELSNSLAGEEHSFFMINLGTRVSEDRSNNLPNFGGPVGFTATQNGYDMDIIVKPDDPDFVTIGTINLYRSRDGFATSQNGQGTAQRDEFWIGGYAKANNVSLYPNQHPDQHIQVYDPTNPNRLWAGHDGGLSVTDDVTAIDVSWTDRNEGYIVTQFYDASIGVDEDDTRFMGGAQDNGTPFFEFQEDEADIGFISADVSSGDGAVSFFTENFIFVSTQRGPIRRCPEDSPSTCRTGGPGFSFVHPAQASGQIFVHPYTVDPTDGTIMYYPSTDEQGTDNPADDRSTIFRNTAVDEISTGNRGGATQGWVNLAATQLPTGYIITALSVSNSSPSDRLYYAGSLGGVPIINRLDNASSTNTPTDISIPNAPDGAYVNHIAVNPINGNELLVSMSNYNVVGLYHSTSGGNSWQAVEGNLTGGNLQGDLAFGPSLRSTTIVPGESGAIYLVGTSTGLYATQNLDGENTQWARESAFDNNGTGPQNADIGFSIVEDISLRSSNGDVAVGTHGRGMFVGRFQGEVAVPQLNPRISTDPASARAGEQITINALDFQFSPDITGDDIEFGEINVREIVSVSPNEIVVIVPQGTVPRDAEPNSSGNVPITITVDTESNGQLTTDFQIEPPNENGLGQNFPNPFGTSGTNIPISLRNSSTVTLEIYDTSGRRVEQTLVDEPFQAGTYTIRVDFSNQASGIYIYRIIAKPSGGAGDTFVDSEKFTFIR